MKKVLQFLTPLELIVKKPNSKITVGNFLLEICEKVYLITSIESYTLLCDKHPQQNFCDFMSTIESCPVKQY